VALRVGELLQSDNVSVQQLSQLLRTDPALSAKLLRVVNSPHFGIPGGVSDIARAIPFVGFATLAQLVLSIGVMDSLAVKSASFDATPLWLHALAVATAARELATELKFSDGGSCFTAGLLHDMGKIALAKAEPVGLAAVCASVRDDGLSLREAETLHQLPSHEQIGARLSRQWRLPATLAIPIEHHHDIHEADVRDRLAPALRTITEIVSAADLLSRRGSAGADDRFIEDGDDQAMSIFERRGITPAQIEAVCERTRAQLEKSKVILSLL
jgi:putative nucleotidyltransferase with HDIG domain